MLIYINIFFVFVVSNFIACYIVLFIVFFEPYVDVFIYFFKHYSQFNEFISPICLYKRYPAITLVIFLNL